jgi:hypothetical protein
MRRGVNQKSGLTEQRRGEYEIDQDSQSNLKQQQNADHSAGFDIGVHRVPRSKNDASVEENPSRRMCHRSQTNGLYLIQG